MAQHRVGHIRIRDDAEGLVEEMRAAGQVRTYVLGKTLIWQSENMPRSTCGLTQGSYKPHSETRDVVCVKYCIHVFMTIPWKNASKCMVSHVRGGAGREGGGEGEESGRGDA